VKPKAIRGMNDVLPDASGTWRYLETIVREVVESYGYREIRLPLVEYTELFRRSIGEVTDIVEKEMYTFEDRNGESLTLRPEATASMVRAGITNGLLHNQRQKLWTAGAMFRYEKPQKGRYRQFHQFDVEAMDTRARYREELVSYFSAVKSKLDEDSIRRLGKNPLRILDSKSPEMQGLIADAPVMLEFLDEESSRHFAGLKTLLDAAEVPYTVNPRLVRGLDYYNLTVFEWLTDALGSQGSVCSGGRYNGLVEKLGGRPTPAVGWAMGIERLVGLYEACGGEPRIGKPDVYIVAVGETATGRGFELAESLRDALPAVQVELNLGGGSFKVQLKRADKSGAAFAIILGEEEVARGEAGLKPLRSEEDQINVPLDDLADTIGQHF